MHSSPPANGFRTFLIVWFTQSISVFGSALTLFAVNIWLTQTRFARPDQKPELAAALAAFNLAYTIPLIFGAPLAGAWADRHDRKQTMFVSDVLSGVLSLALMGLLATGNLQVWMLMIIGALAALVSAFHGAAFDTSYAMLVTESQLPRANGMMQMIWSLSSILSPALAAALIALPALARQGMVTGSLGALLASFRDGAPLAIGVDALTFFIAAAFLPFLTIPSPKRTDLQAADGVPKQSFWHDMQIGARYIWQRRPLFWLLGAFAVLNFIGGITDLLALLFLKYNLAADWTARGFTYESALALYSSLAGIGGVIGGLVISAWGGLKQKRVYGVIVPMFFQGVGLVLIGRSSWLYLMVAADCLLVSGLRPILNAHSQTIWQAQTPLELQGRVFAVRRLLAQATWPISTLLAGAIGGLFDPGNLITILGAIYALYCLTQWFNPQLRQVEDKNALDALAAQYKPH